MGQEPLVGQVICPRREPAIIVLLSRYGLKLTL